MMTQTKWENELNVFIQELKDELWAVGAENFARWDDLDEAQEALEQDEEGES